MLDLKSTGTTAAELPRTTAFTNLSMLFADASSSYKGGWSHATSPGPGQAITIASGESLALILMASLYLEAYQPQSGSLWFSWSFKRTFYLTLSADSSPLSGLDLWSAIFAHIQHFHILSGAASAHRPHLQSAAVPAAGVQVNRKFTSDSTRDNHPKIRAVPAGSYKRLLLLLILPLSPFDPPKGPLTRYLCIGTRIPLVFHRDAQRGYKPPQATRISPPWTEQFTNGDYKRRKRKRRSFVTAATKSFDWV
ncbi:hypothetical protein KQX54_019925 [Cotesia glomerata]|uniref:Uncharacterized protein n=1 Tax=Cotesia glomerata TaxID=32391 RepID=A0AAV7HZV3_COTGL|nr:hypothetical protein KQX54_019925 [Cotesia glomerata]